MTIRNFENSQPHIADSAYVDPTALVIGNVSLGEDSYILPMTVVRGDIHSITIGKRTNIQDNSVVHVTHKSEFSTHGHPVKIGDDVTIGHRVVLHGCTIMDRCLIGMGAIIMDGAIIHPETYIAAGALVSPGKALEGGFLYRGSPAKKVRPLTQEELAFLDYSAMHYAKLKDRHRHENQ